MTQEDRPDIARVFHLKLKAKDEILNKGISGRPAVYIDVIEFFMLIKLADYASSLSYVS